LTGCPSIKDMAISGARVIIKQSLRFYSDRFVFATSTRQKLRQFDPAMPCAVTPRYRNTLWSDLVVLGNKQINNEEYPSRRPSKNEKKALELGKITLNDVTLKKTPLKKQPDYIKNLWNFCKSQELSTELTKSLFSSFCKVHFCSLDDQSRRINFKTPTNKLVKACNNLLPDHTSVPSSKSCVMCGDDVESDTTQCISCGRPIHNHCRVVLYKYGKAKDWLSVGCPDSFECAHLDFTLLPSDARHFYSAAGRLDILLQAKPVLTSKKVRFLNGSMMCRYCSKLVDLSETDHVYNCTELTDSPIPRKLRSIDVTELERSKKEKSKMQEIVPLLKKKAVRDLSHTREILKSKRKRCTE